jgi:hypothetical protein
MPVRPAYNPDQFRGVYADPSELGSELPNSTVGDYAYVESTGTHWYWDYNTDAWKEWAGGGGGSGDVVGPTGATDEAIARYDSATGKLIQNSLVLIDDSGNITLPALATFDGRDVSVDGTKLDTIEPNAKDDQNAAEVPVDTTNFTNNLSAADDTVQKALDTIDDLAIGGTGDVVGPGSATDEAVARFDSTTGKLIQNSTVTIDDSGNIATSGTVDGRDVSTDGTKLDGIEAGATADQDAVDVPVTTTSFDGILSAADTNVQLALDTIDDHIHDASVITFTPTTPSDWNSGVDPGNTNDALDQLAANLNPLLPSAAPILDNIDWDSSDGVTGANTWNASNPISGYVNAGAAGSVNNSGDNVDVQMGTSGNEHGIYDYDSPSTKNGTLNEDVASTDNYPANAFGPGGSDGGSVNTLYLKLNGSTLHSVNLLTFGSGDSVNGNGSGFISLSDDTPVYFADLTPFPARTYRTGSWRVATSDMVRGYNVITVEHETDSGTQVTNVQEFILDDDNTSTSFSGEVLDTLNMTGSVHLSGVEYHTGGTAQYNINIDNAYRNTYDDTDAISFNETNVNNLSNEDLSASGGDEAKQHVINNKSVTISNSRKINSTIGVTTTVNRTVQSDLTSSGGTIAGILMDPTSANSTDLIEYFNDEAKRIHGGSNFNNDLSSNWDETESLVGADANYNDGLQITEGKLYYPGGASISNYATAQAPSGNPNYGSASGVRHYWRLFTNGVATSAFRLLIQGDFTLISDATIFSGSPNNQIKVAIRWPSQTGWLDLEVEFNEGDFGSTSESARFGKDNGDSLTDGCHSTTLDSGSAKGITIGTKTTADSYDKLYVRIITSPNFTGSINDLTLTWNAS